MITFTPLDGGSRTGLLRIVHDADGSPTLIPLSGVGQDFSITAYPASLAVPSGSVVQMSALVQLEGGWADPVAVSCTGLPAPGRCVLGAAAAAVTLLVGACGGGGTLPGGGGAGALGAGTYPITLHAVSAGVERTATVSLTVR